MRPREARGSGSWLEALEFGVDGAVEIGCGPGSGEQHSIDEESGRSGDARRAGFPDVVLDLLLEALLTLALLEGRYIEFQFLGVVLQLIVGERARVLEELVVVCPEFALLLRAERRLGGGTGALVTGQRKVALDDSHILGIALHHLSERGQNA